MSMTPVELALAIVAKKRDPDAPGDRQDRSGDATALAETGAFSVPHIIAMTGLPRTYAYKLLAGKNPQKLGGNLNVEHLELINDVALNWRQHRTVRMDDVETIISGGTSPRMLARLTGIHFNTIYRWLGSGKKP